jgi:malonyl-CoA/methylmalonyl-CoA synthetase
MRGHTSSFVRSLFGARGPTVRDLTRNTNVPASVLRAHALEIAYLLAKPRRGFAAPSWRRSVRNRLAVSASRLWLPFPVNDAGRHSVALLLEPGASFVCALGAVWGSGRLAVPLSHKNPAADLRYAFRNSGATTIICSKSTLQLARRVGGANVRLIVADDKRVCKTPSTFTEEFLRTPSAVNSALKARSGEASFGDLDSLIIYTSGTTGTPKGVVHTFASVENQIQVLRGAWRWTSKDRTLCVLPLHHVHGLINVVGCAVSSGATLSFRFPFSAKSTFNELNHGRVSLFMAVPPVFAKLQDYAAANLSPEQVKCFGNICRCNTRLFVSGSSALPLTVRSKCETFLGGHKILERYGMTEIGMALSQPLDPETAREAGTVGAPLPTVACAVRNNTELLVKSPSVFNRYWQLPSATAKEFEIRGGSRWFRTGDSCEVDSHGNYRILGRLSADVLKVNSFKVSALEIENNLLDSGLVKEVAVFASVSPPTELSDWVVALCVPSDPRITPDDVHRFAAANLAKYKQPNEVLWTDEIPRNAMGKINKKALARAYAGKAATTS